MTIIRHELKQGKNSLLIWTGSIGFLLAICIFLFPEMKDGMDSVSALFASMGSFTAAFGMDRLSFGTLIGYSAAVLSQAILPLALSFAGGTMLYIVGDEMIPETHSRGHEKLATFSLMAGFFVMIVVDCLL